MSSDYFLNKYLGLNQPVEKDLDEEMVGAITGLPETQSYGSMVKKLTQAQVLNEATTGVLEEDPVAIKSAQDMFQKPQGDAVAAQTRIVNEAQSFEDEAEFKTISEYVSNRNYIMEQSAKFMADAAAMRYDEGELSGNPLVDAMAYTLNTVGEFVDTSIPLGYLANMERFLKRFDPNYGIGASVRKPADRIEAMQNYVRTLKPEEFDKLTSEMLPWMKKNTGTLLKGSNSYEYQMFVNNFFGALASGDAQSKWDNYLNPAILALDLLGAGGTAKGVARIAKGLPNKADPRTFRQLLNNERITADMVTPESRLASATQYVVEGSKPNAFVGQLLRTEKGVQRLLEADKRSLGKLSTDKGDLVTELLVPKLSGKPTPSMQLDEMYFKPEERDAIRAALRADREAAIPKQRLKDMSVLPNETGSTVVSYIGNAKGGSYKNSQVAQRIGENYSPYPFRVVEDGAGGYLIRTEEVVPYKLEDVGKFNDEVKRLGKGRGIGRGSTFTDHLNYVFGQAEILSAKAQARVQATLKPYSDLVGADRVAVHDLLRKAEDAGSKFDKSVKELRAQGYTPKQIDAFNAVQEVHDKLWTLRNINTRTTLESMGFKALKVGKNQRFMRPMSFDEVGKLPNDTGRVIDFESNTVGKLDAYRSQAGQFYQLADPVQGAQMVFVRQGLKPKFTALPGVVTNKRANYLGRYYQAPYFVRIKQSDGTFVTRYTAGSKGAAEQFVLKHNKANGPGSAESFRALETVGSAETFDDLARMRADGRLITSGRQDTPLIDVEDAVGTRMVDIEDAISRVAGSTVIQESYGPMMAVLARRFDNTYSKRLGWKFNATQSPTSALSKTADEALLNEAKAIHSHAQLVGGLHSSQNGTIQFYKNMAADLFYAGKDLPFGIGKLSEITGQNLQGLSKSAFVAAKAVPFVTYLALNPVVQGVLQMSMIPTYAGTKHGLKYMRSGQLHRDFLGILNYQDEFALKQIAAASKVDEKAFLDKMEAFRNSGMVELVDTHLWQASLMTEARTGTKNRFTRHAEDLVNKTKAIGFDIGVKTDKISAWLVAYEDAIRANKGAKLTTAQQKEVAVKAEAMTGNINRSDPLFSSDGILSTWLQFASHGIKMTNRMAGAASGGRIGSETFISVADQRRMVVSSLLMYGMKGFNAGAQVAWLNKVAFDNKMTPEAQLAVEEGMIGTAFNMAMNVGLDPEEKDTWQFSGRFSPFTNAGTHMEGLALLAGGIIDLASGDGFPVGEIWENAVPTAASLGLVGDLAQVGNFAIELAFQPTISASEATLATAEEVFRKIPVANNTLKAVIAYNLGVLVDGKGNPVDEVSSRGAIAAVLGVSQTAGSQAYYDALTTAYGTYGGSNGTGVFEEIDKEAKSTAKWMIPYLRKISSGEIDPEEALNLVKDHRMGMFFGLKPHQFDRYWSAVLREIEKSDIMRNERFLQSLMRKVDSGDVSAETAYDRFATIMKETPGGEQMITELQRQMGLEQEYNEEFE